MDAIESVEYSCVDDHGCNQVVPQKLNRQQQPADQAANRNLANDDNFFRLLEEQADDLEDTSNGAARKPDWEVSFANAAAKIGPSDLADFLDKEPDTYPPLPVFRLMRFLDYYGTALSGVSCPWREMFKESNLARLFDVIDVPLSHIPEPVYQTSVDWINQQVPEDLRCTFVLSTFNYILCDLFTQAGGILEGLLPRGVEGTCCKSKVAMFVTLAMVVRSKPHVLTKVLTSLRLRRMYKGQGQIPLTVWLITQASKADLSVGLLSWAHNLLPLVGSNPQSTDVILKLVEKILAKPDDLARFVKAPVWEGKRLIPPQSFEILLRLTFPTSSARVEPTTSRFEAIYPLLKKVALARTSRSQAIEMIFTFSLRLSGEGNTVLAEEARSIAIWSLTVNKDCWKHWENLYDNNLNASVALLKKLVGKFKDGASEAMNQQIFTFSLNLAREGNPVLPQQATAIAIWSLTIIVDCWKQRGKISEENLEACVALLKELVERWKDHSLNLSSSASDTLGGSPGSKAWKQITRKIFTLSLKLAGEANPVLAKEATRIAIWSLNKNVDCWKNWDNLYKENLEASVALLKMLVEEWKDHSVKLSSSLSDTLTLDQTIKSFMQQNKNAITGGGANGSLYKEADKSCKVISWRLSRVRSTLTLKDTAITAMVLVAVVILATGAHVLSFNLVATAKLKRLLN